MAGKLQRAVAADGWDNLFTRRGVDDKKTGRSYSTSNLLDEGELSDLYNSNGIARKLVNKRVEVMMQKGFVVNGDPDNYVSKTLDTLTDAWSQLEEFFCWDRLHGGALLVAGVDDGSLDFERPLDLSKVRRLNFLKAYDRWQVIVNRPMDLYQDMSRPNYGRVQYYTVIPYDGLNQFRVHETRCRVLTGGKTPNRFRQWNQGWGVSVLEFVYEELEQLGVAFDNVDSILEDFVTSTITMENLMELLINNQEEVVKKRLQYIDESKSLLNTVLLDKDETYNKTVASVAGLPDVLDRFCTKLAAAGDTPARVLFGMQQGGLNNAGEGETGDWYDSIMSEQVRKYKPVLEWLTTIVMAARDGYFRGKAPKTWFIEFEPLRESTPKEVAEIYKLNTDADVALVSAGVITEAEVAISRFKGKKYGNNILLSTDDREGLVDETDDELVTEVNGDKATQS
jgi:uncharacterized protein